MDQFSLFGARLVAAILTATSLAIDPRTKQVLASDKSSSLGAEIESDLANLLIKKFKAAR